MRDERSWFEATLTKFRDEGKIDRAVELRRRDAALANIDPDVAESEERQWWLTRTIERTQKAMAENPKGLRARASGKDPLDYIEPTVQAPIARVMKHGADKYGYRNYILSSLKTRDYIAAAERHLNALKRGEDIDPDSGESHWAHVIAGSSCYFACELAGKHEDDREPEIIEHDASIDYSVTI